MAFLSKDVLAGIGFKHIGRKVKISDKAVFYGVERISIGDNTRIDDFCILSAGEEGIEIGRYIHIAAFCSIIGKKLIKLHDFSGLSSRVSLYSSSDDYSGEFLTNPTIPIELTNVDHRPVTIGKHVIIGVGSTILPGVTIGKGTAVGAYSLVSRDLPESVIAIGVPAKIIKPRKNNIFQLENGL